VETQRTTAPLAQDLKSAHRLIAELLGSETTLRRELDLSTRREKILHEQIDESSKREHVLHEQIEAERRRVEALEPQLHWLRKHVFGRRSESGVSAADADRCPRTCRARSWSCCRPPRTCAAKGAKPTR